MTDPERPPKPVLYCADCKRTIAARPDGGMHRHRCIGPDGREIVGGGPSTDPVN
jgi:hypothetical protein